MVMSARLIFVHRRPVDGTSRNQNCRRQTVLGLVVGWLKGFGDLQHYIEGAGTRAGVTMGDKIVSRSKKLSQTPIRRGLSFDAKTT